MSKIQQKQRKVLKSWLFVRVLRKVPKLGKYKTWTPGPWTPSVDRVHQNMDLVHGPPFMDRVHGPPYHGPGPWTDRKSVV